MSCLRIDAMHDGVEARQGTEAREQVTRGLGGWLAVVNPRVWIDVVESITSQQNLI